MAFTIDPEFAFPKVNASAGRKERETGTGGTGDAFAEALRQAGIEPGTDQKADTGKPEATKKAAGTDQTASTTPALPPAPEAEDASAKGTEDSETGRIAQAVSTGTASPVTWDDSEAPALETTDETDAADKVEPALANTQIVPADTAQQATVAEAVDVPDAAAAATAPATPAPKHAGPDAPERTEPRQAPIRDKTGPAVADAPSPDAQVLAANAAAQSARPADTGKSGTGAKADTVAMTSVSGKALGAVPQASGPAVTQTGVQGTGPAAGQRPATGQEAKFHLAEPEGEAAIETAAAKFANTDEASKTKAANGSPQSSEAAMMSAAQPAQPGPAPQAAQTANPATNLMTTTNGILTASPAEAVKVITDSIASPDDRQDRITVQLDPPELGRVSIDFKFNAHGLQHVTITGDNPEALRQLRLMHFELTQALENSGLSSENMSFQQQAQSGQQQQAQSGPAPRQYSPAIQAEASIPSAPPQQTARPVRTADGGLDIRL